MTKEKMLAKIEKKCRNIADHFAPSVKEKIVEVSLNAKNDIFRDILKNAKTWGMIAICAAPLFYVKGSNSGFILKDPERAINIVYNEIHVVNNYKGGN